MEGKELFGGFKYCDLCRRPLPNTYEDPLCPVCKDLQLFRNVKEYIRQNDVTEFDVADHFQIPLHRVKKWIREGRIEYKEEQLNSKIIGQCQQCGAPITFGSLCTKCLKIKNTSGHSTELPDFDASRMRYLDTND